MCEIVPHPVAYVCTVVEVTLSTRQDRESQPGHRSGGCSTCGVAWGCGQGQKQGPTWERGVGQSLPLSLAGAALSMKTLLLLAVIMACGKR